MGITNPYWRGEQTFGWGVYWGIIFPGRGMRKFSASGGGGTTPNFPVGKIIWVEFEKHGLYTLLQGLRISSKICLLY